MRDAVVRFISSQGEGEGSVKFESEDAVCVRGAYGRDGGGA
jgi:hypothetical protein